MDYVANFNNELVYCQAVEKLMGLDVPERAEYVRVILCELNRIASHLLYVGTIGLDAGAMTPTMFAFRGRERIQSLFEAISGARMMHNYFRIGGVKEDLPDDFEQRIAELLPVLRQDVEESDRILTFNEIFLTRLKDVGAISPEEAIDFGFTGPCLRGCGVEYDVRKARPYSVYDRFDFEVPVGPGRRLLGPALGARPGNVRVPEDYRAGLGADSRRGSGFLPWAPPHSAAGRGGVRADREPPGRDWRSPDQQWHRPPVPFEGAAAVLLQSFGHQATAAGLVDCGLGGDSRFAGYRAGGGGPVMPFAPPLLAVTVLEVAWMVVALLLMFSGLSAVVLSLVWLERKALGRLQMRLGPTRTGLFGLLQPVADAVKLILKEDIVPNSSDRAIFWAAPVIVVLSAFMIWVTIPAAEGLVLRNLELGLFYITAFAVIGILGLVLAGWGSANKYGVLGGLRSAAQLISYEIPVIMVVVAVGMLAQSLDLRVIVASQENIPYALILPLGMVVFFIAGLAEVGRTPFDIYHAESEVVGGPFVEYSGAHWSVFFLAEYINTFAIAALVTLLFLGGWTWPWGAAALAWLPSLPDVPWLAPLLSLIWFLIKVYAVILVVFWIRGTFPRLRIDQLMAFAWKAMVPISFYAIVITAVYLFYDWPGWSLTLMSVAGLALVGYIVYRKMMEPVRRVAEIKARQAAQASQSTGVYARPASPARSLNYAEQR